MELMYQQNDNFQNEERNYGLDLLKAISIFLVILQHALGTIALNLSFSNYNFFIVAPFFKLCFTNVPCFFMISGFFLSKKFRLKKIISLWLEISIISFLCTIITMIIGITPWNALNLLKCFIPITTNTFWFISCYFLILFFAPFLKIVIDKISLKQFFLLILLLFFTNYIFLFQYSEYTLNYALICFLLGSFIKKSIVENSKFTSGKKLTCFLYYILFMLVYVILDFLTSKTENAYFLFLLTRLASISLLLASCCLFLFFRKLTVKSSFPSFLVQFTLVVYIIDQVPAFTDFLHYRIYNLSAFINSFALFPLTLCCCVIVFAFGVIIGFIYKKTIDIGYNKIYDFLSQKLSTMKQNTK